MYTPGLGEDTHLRVTCLNPMWPSVSTTINVTIFQPDICQQLFMTPNK